MLKPELLKILACPQCQGELEYKDGEQKLACKNCRLKYPIENDIPIMLLERAEKF